ncbi:MAG: hypothetical protein PUC70_05315 [bacterium]|nr:hypothetical protein [bacterium]
MKPIPISKPKDYSKKTLLDFFRAEASQYKTELDKINLDKKERASKMNQFLMESKQSIINWIPNFGNLQKRLEVILLITYCANLVMLEFRNNIWNYDYMAFSRRIGEIWEPFCKLAFEYPVNKIKIIEPLTFSKVQHEIIEQVYSFISNLAIEDFKKDVLKGYYDRTFSFIDSGSINLSLDLHIEYESKKYNIDFKSGFNSNEKGNTNRLLLVGSIYSSISDSYVNMILVRSPENQNNHYLQTLRNSPYWKVYCADEAYDEIKKLSGFDIKKWMTENMDWRNDISAEFRRYLETNNLLDYLTW